MIRDWELVEFGWYKDYKVRVQVDGKEIEMQTEGWREGQGIDREVEGKNYEPFLNELSDFQRVAKKAREEYLAKLKMQEGAISKE